MDDHISRGVERLIRIAIKKGKFEYLKGQGLPLDLSSNPHADLQ